MIPIETYFCFVDYFFYFRCTSTAWCGLWKQFDPKIYSQCLHPEQGHLGSLLLSQIKIRAWINIYIPSYLWIWLFIHVITATVVEVGYGWMVVYQFLWVTIYARPYTDLGLNTQGRNYLTTIISTVLLHRRTVATVLFISCGKANGWGTLNHKSRQVILDHLNPESHLHLQPALGSKYR